MKLIIVFVLLLLLSCGGGTPHRDAYYKKYGGSPQYPTSRTELVTPKNSYRFIGPKPVTNRRNCFGYVNRNGECWGNLHVPSTGMQRCYGDLEGGNCSGPVF